VVIAVAGGAFLLGGAFAIGALRVAHASPDQLAEAMRADAFYSDFRSDAVIVHGTVGSLSTTGGSTTIIFQTAEDWHTECQTTDAMPTTHAGDTLTVVAVAANAERLTSGVLLTGCAISR
jgi:hypothetical protein